MLRAARLGLLLVALLAPWPALAQAPAPATPGGGFSTEAFHSDLFTGAATFGVPIALPPGVNGMTPALTLGYNSGSGNSWVGVGWSLEVGFVARSSRNPSGYVIAVPGGLVSEMVAVGVDANGVGEYRTRVDSFLRIVFNGTSWTTWDKSGRRHYFGASAASRMGSDPATPAGTTQWALDRVSDPSGNTVLYGYSRDNNRLYLDRIDYTSNIVTNLTPARAVKFHLESRSDVEFTYAGSLSIRMIKRLKTIEIVANVSTGDRSGALALTYDQSGDTQRSMLRTITRYGSDVGIDAAGAVTGGTVLPAVSLTYRSGRDYESTALAGRAVALMQRDAIGDFNSDGKADLFWSDGVIWFSRGDGTFDAVTTNVPPRADYRIADIDGDGRADLIDGANGTIYLSAGTGSFTAVAGPTNGLTCSPADYNGDGRFDLTRTTGDVYLSQPNNQFPFAGNIWTPNPPPFPCGPAGDFNGDGKTDIYFEAGAVWFSRGDLGFEGATSNARTGYAQPGDFNGDGKTDLLWPDGTLWTSVGTGTFTVSALGQGPGTPFVGDINGDGLADVVWMTADTLTLWLSRGTAGAPAAPVDGLVQIDNGFGGRASLLYTPASRHANTSLPLAVWTVTSTTTADGRGWSATTTYSYSGGLWSSADREFRGFAQAVSVDPAGTRTTTAFHQDGIKKGQINWVEIADAAGARLRLTQHAYTDVERFPGAYWPRLDQTDVFDYEGQPTARQTGISFAYDTNGNLIRTYHWGDVAVGGDEREELTEYAFSGDTWLTRPTRIRIFGPTGALLRERWLWYDGQPWGQLGTRGLLTREEHRWVGDQGASLNPVVTHTYDDYGHRLTTTDPAGCATTTVWDSSQVHPAQVTTCLGHSTTFTHDGRWGTRLSERDPNDQLTTYEYDRMGRLVKAIGPLDTGSTYGSVTYDYLTWGDPNNQAVVKFQTEQHGTATVHWTTQFFDGLSRGYYSRTSGPSATVIHTETTYDARGLAATTSAPHFSTDPIVLTQNTYDALGRKVRVTHGDGTFTTQSFLPGVVTQTDERGNVRRQYADAYGRLSRVEEVHGTETFVTTYQHSVLGELTRVTNHLGHVTTMSYDLLGRKVGMQDPNMGTWSYAFDSAGRMTSQTDAKNQTLTFTYDLQGRMRTKTYPGGAQVTWTYDDPAVAFSKGRLTRIDDLATSTRFTYNALGRTIETRRLLDATTYVMSQTYDARGRVLSETFPDGETVTYTYNTAGWLASVPGYVTSVTYNARGQRTELRHANGVITTWSYHPTNFRMTRQQAGPGTTPGNEPLVGLRAWARSWTTSAVVFDPAPAGFAYLYRGAICATATSGCEGGDARADTSTGTIIGYLKTSAGAGTVPVYQSTCYSDGTGTCTGWGFGLEANGTAVGHLATSAPDPTSAAAPFVASNGLLLQGVAGTAAAYTWTAVTQTVVTNHTDHLYTTSDTAPEGYTTEGTLGYLHPSAIAGTVGLKRYVNSAGHHFFSTANDPPAGFALESTVGYLDSASAAGLTALHRHHNATTGDYLLTTNATPPGGYVFQATVGYLHTSSVGEPTLLTIPSVQDLAYTHDATGNITAITDAVWTGSRTFTYDARNRLTRAIGSFGPPSGGLPTAADETYTFDAIGNITEKAGIVYAYSDLLHPSAVTATSDGRVYTYDANGNTLNGAGRALAWDADNRLSAVTIQGGNSAAYAYDAAGQRVRKTVDTTTVTRYPFGGYEILPDGTVIKRFAGIAKKSTGTVLFYHLDHLGGTNVITNAAGTKVQLVEYDPWGKVSRSEGDGEASLRFTGQRLDPESGLMYYGGRYYDPVLGRFISPDPFVQAPGDPQALNRYSYVRNNPVNFTDPTGFFFKSLGKFFKNVFKGIVDNLPAIIIGVVAAVAVVATWGAAAPAFVAAYPIVVGAVAGAAGGAAAAATNVALGRAPPESILTGAAFGAVGGAVGGFFAPATNVAWTLGRSVAAGFTAGAVTGGLGAAVNGGNIIEGIAAGGVTGAVMAAAAYGAHKGTQWLPKESVESLASTALGNDQAFTHSGVAGEQSPMYAASGSPDILCDVCSTAAPEVSEAGAGRAAKWLLDWKAMGPGDKFLKSGIGRAGGFYHRPTGLNVHLDYQPYPGHPEPGWHLNVGRGGNTIHIPVHEKLVPDSWRFPQR
jgi:RHS repeat-associated protein